MLNMFEHIIDTTGVNKIMFDYEHVHVIYDDGRELNLEITNRENLNNLFIDLDYPVQLVTMTDMKTIKRVYVRAINVVVTDMPNIMSFELLGDKCNTLSIHGESNILFHTERGYELSNGVGYIFGPTNGFVPSGTTIQGTINIYVNGTSGSFNQHINDDTIRGKYPENTFICQNYITSTDSNDVSIKRLNIKNNEYIHTIEISARHVSIKNMCNLRQLIILTTRTRIKITNCPNVNVMFMNDCVIRKEPSPKTVDAIYDVY